MPFNNGIGDYRALNIGNNNAEYIVPIIKNTIT